MHGRPQPQRLGETLKFLLCVLVALALLGLLQFALHV